MITVVGGVYIERCIQPRWHQFYGSAGRAAAALSSLTEVTLQTYVAEHMRRELEARAASFGRVSLDVTAIDTTVGFDYVHTLSTPSIFPPPHVLQRAPNLDVQTDIILRFGMMEGDAVVRGRRVTYDPQSATSPMRFNANGSSAEQLAIVANGYEVRLLTREVDPEVGARALCSEEKAAVVVVKRGSKGALVITPTSRHEVPAYQTELVFSLGSGDIFAAAFAYFWGEKEFAPEIAADLASRSTARYCESRSAPLLSEADLQSMAFRPVVATSGRVYLAGPFFNLPQRWLIEEARTHLIGMGLQVFSPLHDVGQGPAHKIAPADLEGLSGCDRVLALVDGADPGTMFEVGYAIARGMPVVALAETLSNEELKMIVGSGCKRTDDFVTAIYLTSWIR
jgi:hypothetical protein